MLSLGHLFVFGIFALVIGVMCLEEIWRTRRVMPLITVAATCLPALCLFLAGQTARQAGVTQYGPWSIHEAALMAPTRTYGGLIDRVALGFIVAVFVVGLATQLLTVAAALRWPLVTLLLFAIAMPDTLFDGYSVALRLPIALAFLAVGASSVQNAPTRIVLAGSLVAAVILVVQVFAIGTYWQLLQKQQQELIDALNLALPRHARVITVMDPISSHHYRSAGGQPVSLTPYPHMADLAMISRDVYLPSVFSLANKQPLLGVGPFARFSQRDQPALDPGDLQQTIGVGDEDCKVPGPLKPYCGWERYFDYVLLLKFRLATYIFARPPVTSYQGFVFCPLPGERCRRAGQAAERRLEPSWNMIRVRIVNSSRPAGSRAGQHTDVRHAPVQRRLVEAVRPATDLGEPGGWRQAVVGGDDDIEADRILGEPVRLRYGIHRRIVMVARRAGQRGAVDAICADAAHIVHRGDAARGRDLAAAAKPFAAERPLERLGPRRESEHRQHCGNLRAAREGPCRRPPGCRSSHAITRLAPSPAGTSTNGSAGARKRYSLWLSAVCVPMMTRASNSNIGRRNPPSSASNASTARSHRGNAPQGPRSNRPAGCHNAR